VEITNKHKKTIKEIHEDNDVKAEKEMESLKEKNEDLIKKL
jgi:polyhydroxyalkanoate synthesis regulator phasin